MKKLLVLLALANVLFFTYTYLDSATPGDAVLLHQQVNPEKIKVLPQDKSADISVRKVPVKLAEGPLCLEWGSFGGNEQGRVEQVLEKLQLGEKLSQRKIESTVGYWVFIPALANKAQADKKIRQLDGLGIVEHFLVQENNEFRNAISLGIFKSEDAATKYLAQLRDKGVRSAKAGAREHQLKLVNYVFRDPGEKLVTTLAELKQGFPGSEVKEAACYVDKPLQKVEAKV